MKEGWEKTTLGELCEKTLNIKWSDHEGENFRYIDLSSVSRDSLSITETSEISSDNAPSRAKKIVFENDVIFATTRPTLKRATIIEQQYDSQICSTGYAVLRPNKDIAEAGFIYYFVLSETFMQRMGSLQRGASYPAVSDKDVAQTPLYFPKSLTEQKQIVAILDQTFAAIDQAKANIEKNIQNAKELFQSKLNEIFSQKGEGSASSADKWEEKIIDDLCESIIDCVNKTAPRVDFETDYKMIRTTNIRNGKVSLNSVRYVNEETYEKWIRRQKPQRGDVLFTREAPLGEAGILNTDEKVFLGQRVVSYRTNTSLLNNKFLLYSFQSLAIQNQIKALGSGATVQHMRVPDTKKLVFSVPSLPVQKKIIYCLDSILRDVNFSIENYELKLINLEELKKSILQKAFAGDLTAKGGVI